MRIHFLLPGAHRVPRGAEVAFESIAAEIAKLGLDEVTVVGSGQPLTDVITRTVNDHPNSRIPFL